MAWRQCPDQAAAQPGQPAGRLPRRQRRGRTTVNLARIQTPNQAYNQIPASAEAWLDIRFPPADTDLNGKSAAEITAYLASFCEPGVTPVVNHADRPRRADQAPPRDTQPPASGGTTRALNRRVAARGTGGLRAPRSFRCPCPMPTGTASACRPSARPGSVSIRRLDEPPDAGPHVRWCGRGRGDPAPYPITRRSRRWRASIG
jgi:hypothetical protein